MNKLLYPVTVNGVNYLIDKENVEIKDKDTVLLPNGKIVKAGIKDGEVGWGDELYENGGKFLYFGTEGTKIIAVEYPHKLDDLPQYKLPEWTEDIDLWKAAELAARKNCTYPSGYDDYEQGYVVGYKANKGKWTDEDIKIAYEDGFYSKGTDSPVKDSSVYLQSLNKPKEIESVEIEMVENGDCEIGYNEYINYSPKLDKEGLLIITKVNYYDK